MSEGASILNGGITVDRTPSGQPSLIVGPDGQPYLSCRLDSSVIKTQGTTLSKDLQGFLNSYNLDQHGRVAVLAATLWAEAHRAGWSENRLLEQMRQWLFTCPPLKSHG